MTSLSLQSIFSSDEYSDEGFDRPRWCGKDACYTTLRKWIPPAAPATIAAVDENSDSNNSSDLTATTSSDSNIGSTTAYEIIWHDSASGNSSILVSLDQLMANFPNVGIRVLVIEDYALSIDRSKVLLLTDSQKVWRFRTRGSYWVLDLTDQGNVSQLRRLGGKNTAHSDLMFATFSPTNSAHVAYVRNHNIYVENVNTNEVLTVTTDGSENLINGTFDWVYEEEFQLRNGFRWSPDGGKIAFWQIDQENVPVMNLINNTDGLYAKIIPIPYPKTGQTNPSAKVGIVALDPDLRSKQDVQWLNITEDTRNNYIADMDFNPSSGELILQTLNRLQNDLKVISMTLTAAAAPELRYVFTDRDEAWIDISHGLKWINKHSQFLYLSERSGWRQLYLVSPFSGGDNGDPVALTPPGFDVESVSGADEELRVIYFIASPDDPLCRYLYKVDYDGSNVQRVTPTSDGLFIGTNSYSLSGDAKFAVYSFSNFDRPAITRIIHLPDHVEVAALADNLKLWTNASLVDVPSIEYFTVSVPTGDGENHVDLNGWCLVPKNFDPNSAHKYPALFHVYGEPAAQIVRRQWGGKVALWHRMLAQRGAVVLCVDNRGTPAPKGSAWRKAIYRQVGILASADQAAAVKSILNSRAYIDPSRVAVWGWSGGGSMSLNALFRYPDIYSCAVSVAPVPDMRLYDTIYQERYMGLPSDNAEGYRLGSPITFAHQMQESQNLLLIHGTGDDNCHYQGTELLINELIKFNKSFQMLAYPNRSHSISEGANTTRHLFEQITRFLQANRIIE